jgi:hypothetical protein
LSTHLCLSLPSGLFPGYAVKKIQQVRKASKWMVYV